ncbi:MAG: energy transducer TonB [Gemmatimonadota bacterium]
MVERARVDRSVGATFLLAALSMGCTETVRPVLGGLKIGPAADGPFVMPVLENDRPPFEYPRAAWLRGVGGETILRIHIASNGAVDTVAVAESSGDQALDSAAVAGAHLLRYRPAKRGEELVSVWAYLPVRYPMPTPAKRADGGVR